VVAVAEAEEVEVVVTQGTINMQAAITTPVATPTGMENLWSRNCCEVERTWCSPCSMASLPAVSGPPQRDHGTGCKTRMLSCHIS
jgi:hypothetical protein